jgi:hypothetical protein
LCFLGARQSKTLPVWGLFFGFNNIITIPHLVTSNDIFKNIFVICFLEQISYHQSRVLVQILLRPNTFLNLLLTRTNGYSTLFCNFSNI